MWDEKDEFEDEVLGHFGRPIDFEDLGEPDEGTSAQFRDDAPGTVESWKRWIRDQHTEHFMRILRNMNMEAQSALESGEGLFIARAQGAKAFIKGALHAPGEIVRDKMEVERDEEGAIENE